MFNLFFVYLREIKSYNNGTYTQLSITWCLCRRIKRIPDTHSKEGHDLWQAWQAYGEIQQRSPDNVQGTIKDGVLAHVRVLHDTIYSGVF